MATSCIEGLNNAIELCKEAKLELKHCNEDPDHGNSKHPGGLWQNSTYAHLAGLALTYANAKLDIAVFHYKSLLDPTLEVGLDKLIQLQIAEHEASRAYTYFFAGEESC